MSTTYSIMKISSGFAGVEATSNVSCVRKNKFPATVHIAGTQQVPSPTGDGVTNGFVQGPPSPEPPSPRSSCHLGRREELLDMTCRRPFVVLFPSRTPFSKHSKALVAQQFKRLLFALSSSDSASSHSRFGPYISTTRFFRHVLLPCSSIVFAMY